MANSIQELDGLTREEYIEYLKSTGDNLDVLDNIGTCATCRYFWHRTSRCIPTCHRMMQPAFPPVNNNFDCNTRSALEHLKAETCSLYNEELTCRIDPGKTRPPPKKVHEELMVRIARAKLNGTISPKYKSPFK